MRFYWGPAAAVGDEDKQQIPLLARLGVASWFLKWGEEQGRISKSGWSDGLGGLLTPGWCCGCWEGLGARNQTHVSCSCRWILYHCTTWGT